MTIDEKYMQRCIELATSGAGQVAPNPMVGAVLVHDQTIIGEGYHQFYGQAHAEVNCLRAVSEDNKKYIPAATLYVSLEPCVHHGKTPPCTDLIIEHRIPRVVLGCGDPFEKVNGKGIDKLRNAGVEVKTFVLEKECIELNRRFFTFYQKHRPYIILKWAQSANAKLARQDFSRVFISNEITNRLVHRWRSEESSIMVGTNTALRDDPELTVRLWKGKNPVRLVIDMNLNLPQHLKIFNTQAHTIIFNSIKHLGAGNLLYYQVTQGRSVIAQVVQALHQLRIQSVLVEGGARLLQSFIDEGIWDEARIIMNEDLMIEDGLPAPDLRNATQTHIDTVLNDRIHYYHPHIIKN